MKAMRSSIEQCGNRCNRAGGFTLVEMMITIAVLGILATLAVPSFQEFIASQRVKTASFELFSSLNLARSEAIKRNSDVTLTAVSYPGGEVGWEITTSGGETIRTQGALKGIVITSGVTEVTYTGTGRATTSPTFQIDTSSTATANVRCISIDLSGRPTSKREAC